MPIQPSSLGRPSGVRFDVQWTASTRCMLSDADVAARCPDHRDSLTEAQVGLFAHQRYVINLALFCICTKLFMILYWNVTLHFMLFQCNWSGLPFMTAALERPHSQQPFMNGLIPNMISFVMGHRMTSLSLCNSLNFAILPFNSWSESPDNPETYLESLNYLHP